MLEAVAGQPTVLEPQTPAADAFHSLHPTTATSDAGEASLIAHCLYHGDVIPVFEDQTALLRAVEELRGRQILSLYGFFAAIHTGGRFSKADLREFDRRNRQRFPGQKAPLWWAALVA